MVTGGGPGSDARTAGAPMLIRPSRGRRRVLAAGAAGAALLAVALVGSNLWVHLGAHDRVTTAAEAPYRPVALVLGAGVQPDGRPTPFLAARLDVAADLLRRGKVDLLLVSGDDRAEARRESTTMQRYLVEQRGVDPDRIVLDDSGRDTYDSCVRARRVFGVTEVTLVSQAYHLPRALAVCRAVGLDAVAVGDQTMRDYAPPVWAEGATRERFAAVKAVVDVLSRRDPVLGPPQSAVTERLARHGSR